MKLSSLATQALLAGLVSILPIHAANAQVSLYEDDNFAGREVVVSGSQANLMSQGFNDKASSVIVRRGRWQLCTDAEFRGHCLTLGPGAYPSLSRMGMNDQLSSVRDLNGGSFPGWGDSGGDAVLYEHADFQGRSISVNDSMANLSSQGFNDRASSVVIRSGRWQLCSDGDFRGQCVTLGPGEYRNLEALQLNDRLSSIRAAGHHGGGNGWGNGGGQSGYGRDGVTLFEDDNFGGRSVNLQGDTQDLGRAGFNDRTSSILVQGVAWMVCSDADFRGRCVVLQPGRYNSLSNLGLNDKISSARPVESAYGGWRGH